MTLRRELVTQTERFNELGAAWDLLLDQSGGSLFQSHGWILAWWSARMLTEQSRLHIGLCWEGDRLRAVIPCATRRHRGIRVLEWAAKECSDYCDAIAGPSPEAALAQAWRAIASGGFHVVYLSHIRPDATIRRLASARPACALRPSARTDQTLQVGGAGLTGAGWFKALSKKARNNHTRGRRILGELGGEVGGELGSRSGAVSAGVATGADAARKLEQMIDFKRQWLQATNRRSPMLRDDARRLRSLVAYLQDRGALQLFSLDCNGELVAGLVSIVHGQQVAPFFSAFDPRFERASPGTLVIVEQLMWAFDQGLPEVDFLCGDEAYKAKFATSSTRLSAYVGARTRLGHVALAIAERLERPWMLGRFRSARALDQAGPKTAPGPGVPPARLLAGLGGV